MFKVNKWPEAQWKKKEWEQKKKPFDCLQGKKPGKYCKTDLISAVDYPSIHVIQ